MGGPWEPLDVGLGHPGPQVGQEAVVEHRVPAAPQQQGGPPVPVEDGGTRRQRLRRRVVGRDRDVGHEVADRLARAADR